MSKQEDDFQILVKGYEDISHAILDNIENEEKKKEKKANMDNLLGVIHWFLDNLNENQAIEQYAKAHNKTSTAIYKAIERHGKTARDMIQMVWDTPLTPAQSKSIDILLVHAKD